MFRRLRGILAAVLITVACALMPVGTLAAWATYELGDTNAYVATMAPLASDAAVRDDITDAVTNAAMSELGPRIGPGALHDRVGVFVRRAAHSFTGTPAFRTAWDAANRAAHHAVISALRGENNGAVTVDLAPISAQVRQQLIHDGVPFAERIPVRHIDITVLRAGDLATSRKGYHLVQIMGVWVPVAVTVSAVCGTLLAARGRRALIALAAGAALGAVALLAAIAAGRGFALRDLPPDLSAAAAGAVYDALTATVRFTAWIILVTGVAVALLAWLAGWLLRRRSAPAEPPPPTRMSSRARA